MEKPILEVKNIKKQYRMGQIGAGTLTADLQSWWAKKRKKEDPNLKIGQGARLVGTRFMALNGVSFAVQKGETVGIIGVNGAGKSTLLKLISRITAPTEGEIVLRGRIASMLEVGTGFNGEMTGRENIYMNGAILGMTKTEIDSKMDQIIEFSECEEFIDTPVKRYSSGMYVKLAFSVAAHLDSEILIMDEVLAVGDVKFQKKCLGKMSDSANEEGKTVLYVSHNMSTIRQLCSRCIVLKEGKIIFDGDVEKAIAIYSDAIFSQAACQSLANRKIAPNAKIQMTNLTLSGSENLIFGNGDPINLILEWSALSEIKNFGLNVLIRRSDNVPIGYLETKQNISATRGETYKTKITIPTKTLPGGKYILDIGFSKWDAQASETYDFCGNVLAFEMLPYFNQDVGHGWANRWGTTVFPLMDYQNEKSDKISIMGSVK